MQTRPVHTSLVQVVRQLYRRLHLHLGLEDAAADRGLLVFFALVLTAVFIRLSVTFVEMVRHRPTVL